MVPGVTMNNSTVGLFTAPAIVERVEIPARRIDERMQNKDGDDMNRKYIDLPTLSRRVQNGITAQRDLRTLI